MEWRGQARRVEGMDSEVKVGGVEVTGGEVEGGRIVK